MLPDMLHFMLVYLTISVMAAILLLVAFGARVEQVSTLNNAVSLCISYNLLRDPAGDDMFAVRRAPGARPPGQPVQRLLRSTACRHT